MLNKGQGLERHIADIHLEKIAAGDLIYCPASTPAGANPAFCGYNQLMDKSEIIEHLKVVYAITTLLPRKKRATKVHVDEDKQHHVVGGGPGLADSMNPEQSGEDLRRRNDSGILEELDPNLAGKLKRTASSLGTLEPSQSDVGKPSKRSRLKQKKQLGGELIDPALR